MTGSVLLSQFPGSGTGNPFKQREQRKRDLLDKYTMNIIESETLFVIFLVIFGDDHFMVYYFVVDASSIHDSETRLNLHRIGRQPGFAARPTYRPNSLIWLQKLNDLAVAGLDEERGEASKK